jgi:hypothetical protein
MQNERRLTIWHKTVEVVPEQPVIEENVSGRTSASSEQGEGSPAIRALLEERSVNSKDSLAQSHT